MKKFRTVLLGLALAAMAMLWTQQARGGLSYWSWMPEYNYLPPVGDTNQWFQIVEIFPEPKFCFTEGVNWVLDTNSGWFGGTMLIDHNSMTPDEWTTIFNGTSSHHLTFEGNIRTHLDSKGIPTYEEFGGFIDHFAWDIQYQVAEIRWMLGWWTDPETKQIPAYSEYYYMNLTFPIYEGLLGGASWTLTLDELNGIINKNYYNPGAVDLPWLEQWPNPFRDSTTGCYLDSTSHNDVTLQLFRGGFPDGYDCRFDSNFTPRTVVVMIKSNGGDYVPKSFKDINQTEIDNANSTTSVDVPAGTNRIAVFIDDLGLMDIPVGTATVTVPSGKSFFIAKVFDSSSALNSTLGFASGVSPVNDQITIIDNDGSSATFSITNFASGVLGFNTNGTCTWPTRVSALYKNNGGSAKQISVNGWMMHGTRTNWLASGWIPLCWPFPETKTFGSMNFPVNPNGMSLYKWDTAGDHWDIYTYDPDNNGWDVDPSNVSFVPGEGFLVYLTSATNWVMNLPEVVSAGQLKSVLVTVPSGYSLPDLGVTVTCANGLTHTIPTVEAGMKFHVCAGDEVAFEYSDEVTEGMNVCQTQFTDCFGHKSSAATAKAGYDGYTHTLYMLGGLSYGSSAPVEWDDWAMDSPPERSN